VLAYFTPDQTITLQVDSSQDGLGAVLLQQGIPIEYASRSLTPSERNWAQIENELLAVVYGLEHFDQYTYGRTAIINNDHRPLETILKKPLSQSPKRLQTLIMRLNRYNISFCYVSGRELFIADTLSRAVSPFSDSAESRFSRIFNIAGLDEIPDERMLAVKQAIKNDPESILLLETIKQGWPESKQLMPDLIKPYFSLRDSLTHENDVILKGERIFIPKALRAEIKQQLHTTHLGYDSMHRRARDTIFWLGMPSDIKQLAKNCRICQQTQPSNISNTLLFHNEGLSPFEKVGVDIFEFDRRQYLVTVDYFSNFAEIDVLPSLAAK